ncbi:MAG: RHS repeat-associated core domain-containing protein [Victivallaceae bacterium]|nr:RHS repeat-associated core domain-containing protein [Victivallaceae bacterium]
MSDGSNTTNYSYDANGNRTAKNDNTVSHSYSYDRENRLASVSDGSGTIFSAVYDYRTRRISKVENGSTTRYIYDGGVNVEEYSVDAQNQSSLTKVLVRGTGMGGGIGSVLYTEDSTGSNRSFFCYNAIGSTVALTDSTGTVTATTDYEAFGKVVSSSGTSSENRLFCTKEKDSSIGLVDFGFRYYDEDLGRFVTRDPSGYPNGPNNYLYCHNNPINHIDPLGLIELSWSGYFKEVGQTFAGYGDAVVDTAVGVGTMVAHPINTAKGIGNAVMHPIDASKAILNDYGNKLETSRGQASILGEVLIGVATGGALKAASKTGTVAKILEKSGKAGKIVQKGLIKLDDIIVKGKNTLVNKLKGKIAKGAGTVDNIIPDIQTQVKKNAVVIGQDMPNRVIPKAKELGAEFYRPRPNQKPRKWLSQNKKWIKKQMKEGKEIIDIGPGKGKEIRRYYGMEKKAVKKYKKVTKLDMD